MLLLLLLQLLPLLPLLLLLLLLLLPIERHLFRLCILGIHGQGISGPMLVFAFSSFAEDDDDDGERLCLCFFSLPSFLCLPSFFCLRFFSFPSCE